MSQSLAYLFSDPFPTLCTIFPRFFRKDKGKYWWESGGEQKPRGFSLPSLLWAHLLLFYFLLNFLNFYLFWGRERDREREGERESGGGAEREGERIPSRLRTVSAEPDDLGLDPMNLELMTWAKIKSQMLNQVSHPGAPGLTYSSSWLHCLWTRSLLCAPNSCWAALAPRVLVSNLRGTVAGTFCYYLLASPSLFDFPALSILWGERESSQVPHFKIGIIIIVNQSLCEV